MRMRDMEPRRSIRLLDTHGQPVPAHIERVLVRLGRRLRRQFPVLKDELLLVDVMEEAARRIALHEGRSGPIEKLNGYAWVTLRSVAISQMRRGAIKLIQNTLNAHASHEHLVSIPTEAATQEQIERDILLREALDTLSPDERVLCVWKKAGFSSREIARHERCSVAAVDTLFSRVKAKLRRALGVSDRERPSGTHTTEPTGTAEPPSHATRQGNGTDDGE